jgi:hypothetical protein
VDEVYKDPERNLKLISKHIRPEHLGRFAKWLEDLGLDFTHGSFKFTAVDRQVGGVKEERNER